MQKIILIVEDKSEELEKAKSVIAQISDCRAVVVSDLESFERVFNSMKSNLFGVVTDIHFPANERLKEHTQNNPNGLSVVATCVDNNVRVAVCSDVNHHFCQYVDEPIRVFASHQNYTYGKIPFGRDNKDWSNALNNLLNL